MSRQRSLPRDRRIYAVLFPVWFLAGIMLALSWASIWAGHLLAGLVGLTVILFVAGVLAFVLVPIGRAVIRDRLR